MYIFWLSEGSCNHISAGNFHSAKFELKMRENIFQKKEKSTAILLKTEIFTKKKSIKYL